MCRHQPTPFIATLSVLLAAFLQTAARAQDLVADPRVVPLVDLVSKANIEGSVVQLASYHTRRSNQPEALLAKDWLVAQLQAVPGLVVTTTTFSETLAPNVVAELPGKTHPERVLVLGAHYDSINYAGKETPAPGADDNASGTAGIVEAARILAQGEFEATIRLVLFSAEETSFGGAIADVTELITSGTEVIAMMNMDMIAYRADGDTYDLDLILGQTDTELTLYCLDVTQAYLPAFGAKTAVRVGGDSDHYLYQTAGIPTAYFLEDEQNDSPFLHTAKDKVGKSANDFDLARDITKAFVASAASLAQPIDLEIVHAPLADTTDAGGPYTASATVLSHTSESVVSVDLVHRVDGGAWTTKPMVQSATTGDWLGSIPGVMTKGDVDYYLVAIDTAGQEDWSPEARRPGDEHFSFKVGLIEPFFADDFESAGNDGWKTEKVKKENDWQKGTPLGVGDYDPDAAASGVTAWGNDLGQGGGNGKYKAGVTNYLESPPIDCSGRTNVVLRYQRWLSIEDGFYDQAKIKVNGETVWQNHASASAGAEHSVDRAWTLHEVDISEQADGDPSVRVRFQLKSDGGLQYGGWTLDDFTLATVGDGTIDSLVVSDACISVGQGGTAQLSIDAGVAQANQNYLIVISGTGTAPPIVVDGTPIPLVVDPFTFAGLELVNTPLFANFGGQLSSAGTAEATFQWPGAIVPGLAGQELYLAACTVAPVTWASNAVSIEFGF